MTKSLAESASNNFNCYSGYCILQRETVVYGNMKNFDDLYAAVVTRLDGNNEEIFAEVKTEDIIRVCISQPPQCPLPTRGCLTRQSSAS